MISSLGYNENDRNNIQVNLDLENDISGQFLSKYRMDSTFENLFLSTVGYKYW